MIATVAVSILAVVSPFCGTANGWQGGEQQYRFIRSSQGLSWPWFLKKDDHLIEFRANGKKVWVDCLGAPKHGHGGR